MAPLNQLRGVDAHIVPEIVEAHLIVGAISDIRVIGGLALRGGEAVDDQAHLQTQKTVYLAHPLAVALGQVVVDGDNVDAVAGQRVEIGGKSRDQGLALAGLHLRDAALMQHNAAHQLYAVGAKAQNAIRGLAHGGKCLRQDGVQRFAVCKTLLELGGLAPQFLVGQRLVLVAHRVDFVDDGINLL
ncbi:hypothetical protein SDC9_74621 [bioreactor metagenome]|uniref:Uncharacterized protein n=1 Tax=bioreactor metagenome TaxID=1076179 RepID=A0A644YHK3_9ZZZZ